jgi:dTDP-4-dehydrorhamnose 3,5-epimerase-like enzyme
MLEVRTLAIPDVKLIRTNRFSDGGGYFCETFQRPAFAAHRESSATFSRTTNPARTVSERFGVCIFSGRLSRRPSSFEF